MLRPRGAPRSLRGLGAVHAVRPIQNPDGGLMRVHTPGASASHATRRLGIVGLTALLLLSLGATAAPAQPSGGPPPAPVDPQNVVDQSDMTWDDYREVPDRREELYDPDTEGTQVTYRTAVILLE